MKGSKTHAFHLTLWALVMCFVGGNDQVSKMWLGKLHSGLATSSSSSIIIISLTEESQKVTFY